MPSSSTGPASSFLSDLLYFFFPQTYALWVPLLYYFFFTFWSHPFYEHSTNPKVLNIKPSFWVEQDMFVHWAFQPHSFLSYISVQTSHGTETGFPVYVLIKWQKPESTWGLAPDYIMGRKIPVIWAYILTARENNHVIDLSTFYPDTILQIAIVY